MRKENLFPAPEIERLIAKSPDGLLHTAPEQGEKPKRSGPKPYQNKQDEIEICLSCPLKRCRLDSEQQCTRLRMELKKRKEGKHT